MEETEVTRQDNLEMERTAARSARERASAARWDLDIAVFLFAIMIIVIILLFQDIAIEIVAPIALIGLGLVWLVGWRRGRQLYQRFYAEELSNLKQETKRAAKEAVKETIEETIEERVQKALRERWR